MKVKHTATINGEITVPGDKSISHRAVMLGALAKGVTTVQGFLMGEDCLSTVRCFQQLGIPVAVTEERVTITGGGDFAVPGDILDAGNSGTTVRLLMGILAGRPGIRAVLTGDASLTQRPMNRVVSPLTQMGAALSSDANGMLPITVIGRQLRGISYHSPVASAQVKSALLLAGLTASGDTTVIEPSISRDHTERMLAAFGVRLERDGNSVTVAGGQELTGGAVRVPGDISSAAFFMVAAAVVKNGSLVLKNVGINQTRSGIIDALTEMGANISLNNRRSYGYEQVADIAISSGPLKGAVFGGDLIPRLIDELPVLAVAALAAEGKTVIKDAAELRVKESDRIDALARQLIKLGASVTERPDGLEITGGKPLSGAQVSAGGDHRIAMALAVAGLLARGETVVEDADSVAVSFPGFWNELAGLR